VQNARIATLLRKHVLRFKINLRDPTMWKHLILRLLDCTTKLRKHRARVRPNHPHHPYDHHENDCQHDRVLSDIPVLVYSSKDFSGADR